MNIKRTPLACLLAGCTIASLLPVPLKTQAQTRPAIAIASANFSDTAEQAKSAVVRVENGCFVKLRWLKTNKVYSPSAVWKGSGFFVSTQGHLVTNAHVLAAAQDPKECRTKALANLIMQLVEEGEVSLEALNANPEAVGTSVGEGVAIVQNFEPIQTIIMTNGNRVPYRILKTDPGEDVALLKVHTRRSPMLKLGDSDRVRLAESILTIGFPRVADSQPGTGGGSGPLLAVDSDREATCNNGQISSLKRSTTGSTLLQISAAVTHGNSGGPVLNDRGEVIGMVTFGPQQSGFAFAVSSNTISYLLQKAGMNLP